MPLYEYACRACEHTFEMLVRAGDRPTCPACGASTLDRLMSVVSVGGRAEGDAAPAPIGACGTCGDPRGPGSCVS